MVCIAKQDKSRVLQPKYRACGEIFSLPLIACTSLPVGLFPPILQNNGTKMASFLSNHKSYPYIIFNPKLAAYFLNVYSCSIRTITKYPRSLVQLL